MPAPASAPGRRGVLVGLRTATWGHVQARKPRPCPRRLPAGKGEGVASVMGFSWVRPPSVARRKRTRSRAWTHRTLFTVWSLVLPL
jgi:hypothetical protein